MKDSDKKAFYNYKKADFDVSNLINSINKSKELHKELSKISHPDRYVDQKIKISAEELMKEINLNRNDYNKLLLLKEKAKKILK